MCCRVSRKREVLYKAVRPGSTCMDSSYGSTLTTTDPERPMYGGCAHHSVEHDGQRRRMQGRALLQMRRHCSQPCRVRLSRVHLNDETVRKLASNIRICHNTPSVTAGATCGRRAGLLDLVGMRTNAGTQEHAQ